MLRKSSPPPKASMNAPRKPRNAVNPHAPVKPTKPAPTVGTIKVVRTPIQPSPRIMAQKDSSPQRRKAAARKSSITPKIAILLLLIVVTLAFLGGLVVYRSTLGKPVVRNPTAPAVPTPRRRPAATGSGATGSTQPSGGDVTTECIPIETDPLAKPIVQPVGSDKHHGELPEDVKPEGYDITVTLTGASLESGMTVTVRVDAHLSVLKATDKVVLKASERTLHDMRVAMLNGSSTGCPKGNGTAVHSVSRSADFLIVRVTEPLVVGSPYTLSTVHTYHASRNGPIILDKTVVRMQLASGEVHEGFPCYEKKDWRVPLKLRIIAPGSLTAVATPSDLISGKKKKGATRASHGAMREWKFAATMPMPLHKLAWAVFPQTLKEHIILHGKMRQFAEKEDVELRDAAIRSFKFLAQYFQKASNQYVTKIDFVLGAQVQDNIGFQLLQAPAAIKGVDVCEKIAEQWTIHLLPKTREPSWLASSGVAYFCRLAFVDNAESAAKAFQEEIEKCRKRAASDDIKQILQFRMAHTTLGDIATRKAIQKYVDNHLFDDAHAHDVTTAIFAPALPIEKIRAYTSAACKPARLLRLLGAQKKLTPKEP